AESCRPKCLQQFILADSRASEDLKNSEKITDTKLTTVDIKNSIKRPVYYPDFSDNDVYGGQCPKCKKGNLIIRTNSTTLRKFYGCSNFPCKYTVNEYYDYKLGEWFYANDH
ncbi:MAG: topoisomerase DNA-binding C4 zinc finger domain-containing protein, partial [Erysipelotrichaceae bacterium]